MTATGDLFTSVHKGLRSMLYDLSRRLQTNDFADPAATGQLVNDLEIDFAVARSAGCIVCALHHHAEDEESQVFPSVRPFGDGLIASLILDHQALTRREVAIVRSGHELLALADPLARIHAGTTLNQQANELFAAYIAHMNREESDLVPLMREHFTDAQMDGMRDKIIGGMPPDRLFAILGWMLPSLNVTELTGLLSSLKASAPPPVVENIARLCAARVEPARWATVQARTGIVAPATAPGAAA